jgi:hypothetical protein
VADDDLEAAEDYRRQRQQATAKIVGFKPKDLAAQLQWVEENRQALIRIIRGKGPARPDEQGIIETYKQALIGTSEGSSFDDVNARQIVERVLKTIEDVCNENDIEKRAGVAFGTDPVSGLNISQRPVLQTEASIIEVSIHFLSFSNMIAKLLALTIPHELKDGENVWVIRDLEKIEERLQQSLDLVDKWSVMLASFAAVGVQPQGFELLLDDGENAIRTLLLLAIETFSISHEYGHHTSRHGLVADSEESREADFRDEYEADYFARACSIAIGFKEEQVNFYAASGAGGVIILGALELVRRTAAVLESGSEQMPPRRRHPPYLDRVANLARLDERLIEKNRQQAGEYRNFFVELIELVWSFVKPNIVMFHQNNVRPRGKTLDSGGWLPS